MSRIEPEIMIQIRSAIMKELPAAGSSLNRNDLFDIVVIKLKKTA